MTTFLSIYLALLFLHILQTECWNDIEGIHELDDATDGLAAEEGKFVQLRQSLMDIIANNDVNKDDQPGVKDNFFNASNTGERQSPVDIITKHVVKRDLPLLINETTQPGVKAQIFNSGHTVVVFIKEEPPSRPYIKDRTFQNLFIFEQMHFHWGSTDDWGSEHFINGECFSFEINLLHFNPILGPFKNASLKENGLAMLTIFAEIQEIDNALLEPLCRLLPKIAEPNSSQEMDSTAAIQWAASALAVNTEYYMYHGSRTIEPYLENVIYILLPKPIRLSSKQLNAFRKIKNESHGPILGNLRQLQPLRKRLIIHSNITHSSGGTSMFSEIRSGIFGYVYIIFPVCIYGVFI